MTASSPYTKRGIKPGEQKTTLSTNASPVTLERKNTSIWTRHLWTRALVCLTRGRAAVKYYETLKIRESGAGTRRRLWYSHRTGGGSLLFRTEPLFTEWNPLDAHRRRKCCLYRLSETWSFKHWKSILKRQRYLITIGRNKLIQRKNKLFYSITIACQPLLFTGRWSPYFDFSSNSALLAGSQIVKHLLNSPGCCVFLLCVLLINGKAFMTIQCYNTRGKHIN